MPFSAPHHPRAVRIALLAAAITLAVWTLLRVVLWLVTGPSQAGWGNAPGLFARGFAFDLATLAVVVAPWLLASALLPDRWRAARALVALRWVVLWAVVALLLFGAVAELTFWQEFTTRFNFIAVDYLVYTQEVIGNVRQSYPVPAILAAIAGTALAIVLVLRRYVRLATFPLGTRRRLALAALAFALPALSLGLANIAQARKKPWFADTLFVITADHCAAVAGKTRLPKRRVEAFRIDPQTFAATPTNPDLRLVDEATAYYQTASRAFRSGRLRSPDYPAP